MPLFFTHIVARCRFRRLSRVNREGVAAMQRPCGRGATVPAACQALGRALGLIPPARSTLALGPAL